MAGNVDGGGEEEVRELTAQLGKSLKEGERLLAPTRRPDGTLRKPIRIRAGYVPQDEVAIYQSKGALWRKEMASQDVPPGYDPELDAKPFKTKSSKRNERKKEKRLQQAALDKDKTSENNELSSAEDGTDGLEFGQSVALQMNELSISANTTVLNPPSNPTEGVAPGDPVLDIDKRIRALKKKIRLTEAQQQNIKPEQLDKTAKLESWREELKILEDKKAELAAS